MRRLLPLLLLVLSSFLSSFADPSFTLTGIADPHSYLALNNLALAYELLSPTTSITILPPPTLPYPSYTALLSSSVDFITSTTMSLLGVLPPPSVLQLPHAISPLVPVYRLDSFPLNSPPLVLSPAALALIYMGNITWWNDSRLTSLNPLQTLPPLPITVVYQAEGGEISLGFTQAMLSLYPPFAAAIPYSMTPAWPTSAYAAHVAATGLTGVPAAVALTNGAIGYAPWPMALTVGASVASMVNAAGLVVAPSIASALMAAVQGIAVVEQVNPPFLDDGHGLTPTVLTGASGQRAWPMLMTSFFTFTLNASQAGPSCHRRALLYSFLSFVYQSGLVLVRRVRPELHVLPGCGVLAVLHAGRARDRPALPVRQPGVGGSRKSWTAVQCADADDVRGGGGCALRHHPTARARPLLGPAAGNGRRRRLLLHAHHHLRRRCQRCAERYRWTWPSSSSRSSTPHS